MANQHSIIDNPPAFARPCGMHEGGQNSSQEGMTLRDYFAGMALIGLSGRHMTCAVIARSCYDLADSMLNMRKLDLSKTEEL